MKLIVGLGNPGEKYQKTRHNVGFMVLDDIARRQNIKYRIQKNYKAETAIIGSGKNKIILVKPKTYMNASGLAIKTIADFYKIDVDNIVVISDDLNMELGKIKMRMSGEDGGHKGLRSIIENIGEGFWRIRIGIGKNEDIPAEDYVLQNFGREELKTINPSIKEVAQDIINNIHKINIEVI